MPRSIIRWGAQGHVAAIALVSIRINVSSAPAEIVMVDFTRPFRAILKITGLIAVAIVCVAIIVIPSYVLYSLATSPSQRQKFDDVTGLNIFAQFSDPHPPSEVYALSQSQQDLMTVFFDHQVIADWVLGCMGSKSDVKQPGVSWDEVLLLPRQLWGSGAPKTETPNYRYPDNMRPPGQQEKALIALSRAISERRIYLLYKARAAFWGWATLTILAIVSGTATTILVSISSTEFGLGNERYKRTLGGSGLNSLHSELPLLR
jgi:hypothetical protein